MWFLLVAGILHCGGFARPGFREVEFCRAVAVLSNKARVEFTRYETPASLEAAHEDLLFLTEREAGESGLSKSIRRVAAVSLVTSVVVVPQKSAVRSLSDLAGRPICFLLGTNNQFYLQNAFAQRHLGWIPIGFQEKDEMMDAYRVGYCAGLAGERAGLESLRISQRVLPEMLASEPVFVYTYGHRSNIRDAIDLLCIQWGCIE